MRASGEQYIIFFNKFNTISNEPTQIQYSIYQKHPKKELFIVNKSTTCSTNAPLSGDL